MSMLTVCGRCRVNPVDEEGKTRSPEKMTELVHEAHQAHTRKALKALKVLTPPSPPPPAHVHRTGCPP